MLSTLTLLAAGAATAAAAEWSNMTLYHVNEKKFASLGITSMNEGDAAGDMFFAIKSRALPVECPGAYDCNDPEMCTYLPRQTVLRCGLHCNRPRSPRNMTKWTAAVFVLKPPASCPLPAGWWLAGCWLGPLLLLLDADAKDLVISKVTVELDMQYLQSDGLYAECNVNETGNGTAPPIYTCLCHGHSRISGYCNHSIGMQTVRSLPFYRLPSPGAPAPDFWCATVLPSASEKWLAAPDLTSLIDNRSSINLSLD
jgi:hypothetical protein